MILEKLQIIETVSLDFYTNNIKTINVKQYDTNTRFIHVLFTEHGKKVSLNQASMSVIVRYKKNDGKFGLRDCEILEDGSVLIELTEQMTVVSGKTQMDVMILEESGIKADSFAGITSFEEYGVVVLSTMPLNLNIVATPIQGAELESKYDFTPLNMCFASVSAIESDIMTKNVKWTSAEEKRETRVVELIQDCKKNVNDKINEFTTETNKTIEECQTKTNSAVEECEGKTDEAVSKANDATSKASDAASSATNAAGDANTAASNANNAAACANSEAERCKTVYQEISKNTEVVIEECETAIDRANLAAQNCEDIVFGTGMIMQTEKGVSGGVASLDGDGKIPLEQIPDGIQAEVDWDASEPSDGAVKNKPPISNGTGIDSMVIGRGNALGDYSIAGGNIDDDKISLIKVGGALVGADIADGTTANGTGSLAFGLGAKTHSTASIALGVGNSAGAKGFYWWSIDFENKKITLANNQMIAPPVIIGSREWNSDAQTQLAKWTAGDKISLVANTKYGGCSTITSVDATNGTITVDKLPITEEVYPTIAVFDDYAVYNINNISAGIVEFALGALSIGAMTTAAGSFSSALGYRTKVTTDFGHAEGKETVAGGYASHSEGNKTEALGRCSHSEGYLTKAIEENSHAEGRYAEAIGIGSHAEGADTRAEGLISHAEGNQTISSGVGSHSEGYITKATGDYTHAEGYNTVASVAHSHAEGNETVASGIYSHSEGRLTETLGVGSHAEGYLTKATGEHSHAEGRYAEAIGIGSHAEGADTRAEGLASHAEGDRTISSGVCSHSEGYITVAGGDYSHAGGYKTAVYGMCQYVHGKYNIEDDKSVYGKYAHIIGNGSENSPSNAYALSWAGQGYFAKGTTSTGADYAEYFEWKDGNPNNEDRVGLVVALDGGKIRLANIGDEVLGIISGTVAVLGDNYECEWNGKYLTDDFGRLIYEDVEEFVDEVIGIDEETNEPIIEKRSLGFFKHPKINSKYDPTQAYVNRANRPEWDTVGMLGKLYVRDDGTAQVNRYVTVGENGIATLSSEKTNMRVLSRVNENVIRVLLK